MDPIVVDDAETAQWDRSADVVVVGFGGAGASAALQAREEGAEVILIDRFGGGGTTKYSGGVIYAGATRFQREAGIEDSVDNMLAYLKQEVGDAVRPETLRRYCEGSAADLDWLIGHGVQYDHSAYLEKITYPPEGKYLYYSGNEKSPAFAAHAKPAARGHRAVGPGFGGAHYIAALREATLAGGRAAIAPHTGDAAGHRPASAMSSASRRSRCRSSSMTSTRRSMNPPTPTSPTIMPRPRPRCRPWLRWKPARGRGS